VLRLSTRYLDEHGSQSARLDAELLIAHALGVRRLDVYLQFDRPLDADQLVRIRELVRRRAGGEPIAYITGEREFFSRTFAVTRDVLIPRPETETLVEAVLDRVRSRPQLRIADLGTGSGCIAISLAAELPQASVLATDIDDGALRVARSNALNHGVLDRVELSAGDWAGAIDGCVDVVVSNPPYVIPEELAAADRDVRDFEPGLALLGGDDGLDAYRALLQSLPAHVRAGTLVAMEVDPRRCGAVAGLVESLLGATPEVVSDLAGRPRVVLAELGT